MRGDVLRLRLIQRIRESEHQLTIRYPAVRPVITGVAPVTTPLASPLTGQAPTPTIAPAAPTRTQLDAGPIPCLWTESIRIQSMRDRRRVEALGWVEGAHVMARVLVIDAALDPDHPEAGTLFDRCESVLKDGHEYRVLQTVPIGSGFGLAVTYSVWLVGATTQ